MKILSKYKDYYDYLSGIYGEDPKIVLDRRDFGHITFSTIESKKITICVCDVAFDGYYRHGKFYWGQDLLKLLSKSDLEHYEKYSTKDKPTLSITINEGRGYHNPSVSLIPIKLKGDKVNPISRVNTLANCPILYKMPSYGYYNRDHIRFPVLRDIGISSILPPKEIYLMLSEWLAPKDDNIDTRTNKEKIVSSGFDLKTSFRNV